MLMYFIILLTTKIKKQMIFYFVSNISHTFGRTPKSKNHVKHNKFKNIKNFDL